jgi:YIF1
MDSHRFLTQIRKFKRGLFNLLLFVPSLTELYARVSVRVCSLHGFPASTSTSRSNPPYFYPRTSIDPGFPSRLPALRIFSLSSSKLSSLFPCPSLSSISSSAPTSRTFTKPAFNFSQHTRLLCVGYRWSHSPIRHATRPKCGRGGTELRSTQCVSSVSMSSFFSKPVLQLGGLIPVTHLKHHFNVSNSYVIRKLRVVVFPWRHKPWTRKMRRSETGVGEFQPPRDDLNAPDLYIPGMVFPYAISLS